MCAGAAAFGLLLAGGNARAQSAQRFSGQFSGLYAGLFGRAYTQLDPGVGVEAQLRFTPSAWSFGAGVQHTSHDFAILDSHVRVTLAGPFVEPRYVVPSPFRNADPYLSIRLSTLRQSYSVAGFHGSSRGFTINAGGGLLTRVNSRVNLDSGVTYGFTRFGAFQTVDSETSETYTASTGSGSNIVIRIGLAIGLRG